jgi:4-amino-4-deoxy-L-arabinose transferase-like glycosyltransferase
MPSVGLAPKVHRSRAGWDLVALALITCLGGALRLAWIENTTFGFDQARLSVIALEMARDGVWAATGMQSSVGLPNPPAAVWVLALPYRVSTDPLVATRFVALLNTLGIAALGWVARRAWGSLAGLTAAALMALSPWSVLFSRTIWAQNLLAPLTVLWALTGMLAIEGRRRVCLTVHILLAGVAPQIHFSGLALWLPTFWLLWRYRLWRHGWALAAGVTATALAAAPFALAVWPVRHHLLVQLRQMGDQPLRIDVLAWKQLVQMGIGAQWRVILAGGEHDWPAGLLAAQQASVWILGVCLAAGLALLAWGARRVPRAEHRKAGNLLRELTLAWVLASPLLFTARTTDIYHHYMLVALPSLYLAMAYGVSRIASRWVGRAGLGLALAAACLQAALLAQSTSRMAQATGGGSGALRWPRTVARATDDGRTVVVAADCDWEIVCDQANVFDAFLWDRPLQTIDGRNMLLIPAATEVSGAHLVITGSAPQALDVAEGLGLISTRRQDSHGQSQSPYVTLTLSPDWRAQLQTWTPTEPLTLDNGAQMRAWHAAAVGGQVRLWTLWQVVGPIRRGQYQHFAHLYVGKRKVSGHDSSVSLRAWRPGDWLIVWADLDAPAELDGEMLYAETGMYLWPDITRASILERPDDTQAAIRLGPFAWPAEIRVHAP